MLVRPYRVRHFVYCIARRHGEKSSGTYKVLSRLSARANERFPSTTVHAMPLPWHGAEILFPVTKIMHDQSSVRARELVAGTLSYRGLSRRKAKRLHKIFFSLYLGR